MRKESSAARACPDCGMSTCAKDGCAVAEVRADEVEDRSAAYASQQIPERLLPGHENTMQEEVTRWRHEAETYARLYGELLAENEQLRRERDDFEQRLHAYKRGERG